MAAGKIPGRKLMLVVVFVGTSVANMAFTPYGSFDPRTLGFYRCLFMGLVSVMVVFFLVKPHPSTKKESTDDNAGPSNSEA